MADFCITVVAAEPDMNWQDGKFLAAYAENRANANTLAMEASVLTKPVRALLAKGEGMWSGTASELLEKLSGLVGDRVRHSKSWPRAPHTLTGRLRSLAPNLRKIGVNLEFHRGPDSRTVTIRTIGATNDIVRGEV